MHIVCQHCGAINRIPEGKSHTAAKCGKCSDEIYSAQPVELNDANFFHFIEKNDLPLVVDFWAQWCGPCKQMAPTFAAVAAESEGLIFAKVDTQVAQTISAQAGIRSIPTLMFFHKGAEINRVSGAMREAQLKQWIMQCLQQL